MCTPLLSCPCLCLVWQGAQGLPEAPCQPEFRALPTSSAPMQEAPFRGIRKCWSGSGHTWLAGASGLGEQVPLPARDTPLSGWALHCPTRSSSPCLPQRKGPQLILSCSWSRETVAAVRQAPPRTRETLCWKARWRLRPPLRLSCGQRAAWTEPLPQCDRGPCGAVRVGPPSAPWKLVELHTSLWLRLPEGRRKEMVRPGPLGETVSAAQLSGAPAAAHQAPGDPVPSPEDSDLGPSVALAAALALLFLLLSAWLGWGGPVHGCC